MREHNLKLWPAYFKKVKSGEKTFELRRNDRDYRLGDTLNLREWDPFQGAYTGRECRRRITYILDDFYALKAGYVILGLRRPSFQVREVGG